LDECVGCNRGVGSIGRGIARMHASVLRSWRNCVNVAFHWSQTPELPDLGGLAISDALLDFYTDLRVT
jgi:hypothetical protein